MIFINFWQFLFQLMIAGFLLRFAQVKLAGTDLSKALAFIY